MKATLSLSAFFAVALAAPSSHDGFLNPRSTEKTSINWSGAVVQGKNITAVTATFPVLDTKIPAVNETGKHAYQGTAWIGIDGYNKTVCPEGLWQAGVMTSHHALTGEIWFQAWYEWYPDPPVFVDIGDISAGDIINVALNAPTPTQASVVLENQSTGRGFNQTVNLTRPLCLSSAEWIVERAYTLSGLVGLIDFGTETISDITYTVGDELHTSIPDDVTIINIINDEDNNVQQTSTEVSGNTIKVTYLGS
ncbi:concanavalin A-like lectin/glucanase [Daldinia eschscholtzii]|nr:concanavalin A-like lectin/glucanase [Daldinia eschscholtzii]